MLQLEGRGEAVSLWTGLPVCVCVWESVYLLFTQPSGLLAAFKTDADGRH